MRAGIAGWWGGARLAPQCTSDLWRENRVGFEEWERGVSTEIRGDPLWDLRVYRLALYAGDLGRDDATELARRPDCTNLAEQLRRASESVSSNIAEGFSRFFARDRAKFFEYALGSARESRDWYHKARHALGAESSEERLQLHGHLIRILTALIVKARPAKS